jgi:hypothetical protein
LGIALDAPRQGSKYKAVINYRGLENLGLVYGRYGGALDARMGPRDAYVLGFPLSGRSEYKIGSTFGVSSAGRSAIIAPGERADLHYTTHHPLITSFLSSSLRRS